jgi:hypothetical protein
VALAALVIAAWLGAFPGAPGPAQPAEARSPASAAAGGSTGRVLVLSLPTLSWDEVYRGDTPTLDSLLDQSAVAAMSVRDIRRHTNAGDGYAALGAGARARGVGTAGQVLEADEDYLGVPASDVFESLTGTAATDGLLALAHPALVERNDGLDYGAEIGALGQALADARVPRAVIANADGGGFVPEGTFDRTAGLALADESGVVPAGAVSSRLLEHAADAPFGLQLARSAVVAAFEEAWADGGVVLVEGSDLERADRSLEPSPTERRDALRATDDLVGDLLRSVDPSHDSVLVVAPYHRRGEVHLTVAALRSPGMEPGLLRSGSTRRTGVVTLVDIAPTILGLEGVDRPGSMEGRRFERAAQGASSGEARAADLAEMNAASRYRDRMVTPVATLFVVLQAALWVGAALALRRRRPHGRDVVALAALTMLGYLPATYLARLIDFHEASGSAPYYLFVFAVALAIAVLARLAGRASHLDPLLLCLFAIFGLLTVDMLIGAPLQLNAVFGYSPTVGGRFAGMGNLAYGQYAGAAFLLCGLLARRLAPRDDAMVVAFSVLVVAVIIDGMPMWGSDVGGVLAMVPAVGVTAARMFGQRLRWRTLILWGSAAVAAVGAFALVDLSRPPDERTHLGRLVEAIGDQGFGAFESVVRRKLEANFSVIASSVWTAMVPVALGFILYLLWRAPGHLRSIRDTIDESLPGLAVVGFLGFAFNDSGIAVPGVMLGVVNASLVYLTVRTLPSVGDPPLPAVDEPPELHRDREAQVEPSA